MSKALEQLQQSIESQKKRLAQMLAEKQQMEARARAAERVKAKKADTRRKILLGAFVLGRLERENATIDVRTLTIDGAHFLSWLKRPEDRALFSMAQAQSLPSTFDAQAVQQHADSLTPSCVRSGAGPVLDLL